MTLRYNELLKIERMSFEKRIILMFQMYPKNQPYFEELYRSVAFAKSNIKVSYSFSDVYNVSIYVIGLGTFRKHWEEEDFSDKRIFTFSFIKEEDIHWSPTKSDFEVRSKSFNKEESNIICARALPFMVSCGQKKRSLPLLMQDFPDFAGFALSFVPGEVKDE